MTAEFSRSWTNRFGTAFVTLEGGTGQQHLLLFAPLELSRSALEQLERLGAFKGRITLAALEQMHVAPIRAAIQELEPRTIIALEQKDGLVTSGKAKSLEPGSHLSSTGLEYEEPDALPAWHSSLEQQFQNNRNGLSIAASIASSLGFHAVACGVNDLDQVLKMLLEHHRP
jgi:hypothetical protein